MKNNTNQLIAKVLNCEASSEEIISFCQWLSEMEENRKEFRKLKSYWNAKITFKHAINPQLSLQKTQNKILLEQNVLKKKKRILLGISVAASIAILLGIGFFFLNPNANERNISVEYNTYLTKNNKINFTLSDGTKIYLNKNSKLVYTNQYDKTERLVQLEGEGYFEVQHNPEKPFIVEVGDTKIKVLGTSFNVKTDTHANVWAILTKGSIRFEAPNQQVILLPSQQLAYTHFSQQIEIALIDIDRELAWMEGVIRHKSVLFSDMIYELMNQFDVQIVIDNDTLRRSSISMTGTFAENQSLEEILKIISISYPFTWVKKNGIYYIK